MNLESDTDSWEDKDSFESRTPTVYKIVEEEKLPAGIPIEVEELIKVKKPSLPNPPLEYQDITVRVYPLNEKLYMMKNDEIKEFFPRALKIVSYYQGGGGWTMWGQTTGLRGKNAEGYPFEILYNEEGNGIGDKWVHHSKLFTSKEELLNSYL